MWQERDYNPNLYQGASQFTFPPMSNSFDIVTRGMRIGAFSGLAITIFALATDSKWLLEEKYFYKPREKGKHDQLI